MKNENKYSEMIDVMGYLHQYVLVVETKTTTDTAEDLVDKPSSEKLHPLLFCTSERLPRANDQFRHN